jgi:hypothetical protein
MMSSVVVPRILAAVLLAGAVLCGRVALAGAASVEDLLAGQLLSSGTPQLLGPITSAGRKGWDCKPEHAAGAAHWRGAELPAGPDTP